jgi:hypothetical protein
MQAKEIPSELLGAMREIVRYAIMTLAALRDPDAKYLGLAQMPAHVVHDIQQAYGYSSTSVRSFRPSPFEIEQMDTVLPWVAWVRQQEGDLACRRIIGWAMGAPLWRLGQREQCSDRTIMNRIDRSIAAIILKFAGVGITVERIDEPYKGTHYAMILEKPAGPHGAVFIRKVYVGGLGYVRNGKRMRDSADKFHLCGVTA